MDRDRIVPRSEQFLEQYNVNYQSPYMDNWDQELGLHLKNSNNNANQVEKSLFPANNPYEPIFNFAPQQPLVSEADKHFGAMFDMTGDSNWKEPAYLEQQTSKPGKSPSPRVAKSQKGKKLTAKHAASNGNAKSKGKQGSKVDTKDEQRMRRLLRNRVSAQLARERKKHYVQGLEKKSKESDKKIKELNDTNKRLMKENEKLKEELQIALRSGRTGRR